MKLNIQYLTIIFGLPLLLNFASIDLQAKNPKCQCVRIPDRAASTPGAEDPANPAPARIPAANIFVRTEGVFRADKPTVVFIHGFTANLTTWDCAQPVLAEHYYTVALDLRGAGRSTKTPTNGVNATIPAAPHQINYSMQVLAQDVHAVLQDLGVTGKVILVGHSMGSGIAIKYNSLYASSVEKIVLVSGGPLYIACNPGATPEAPACTITLPINTGLQAIGTATVQPNGQFKTTIANVNPGTFQVQACGGSPLTVTVTISCTSD